MRVEVKVQGTKVTGLVTAKDIAKTTPPSAGFMARQPIFFAVAPVQRRSGQVPKHYLACFHHYPNNFPRHPATCLSLVPPERIISRPDHFFAVYLRVLYLP